MSCRKITEGKQVTCPHVSVLLLFSRVRLFCDPMDCSPPGSSVHGISQARILEWVAISFSKRSFQPRDHVSCVASGFFTTEPLGKPSGTLRVKVKSLSCVRLFATPQTVVYQASPSMGFFQARVLEWAAISFSRGSSRPRDKPGYPAL